MKKNNDASYEIKISAVNAVLKGKTIKSVSEMYQKDRSTIHRWLQGFKLKNKISDLRPKKRSGRPIKTSKINYQNLKNELEQQGCSFKTNSDTEVLLNLLIKDGMESEYALKMTSS